MCFLSLPSLTPSSLFPRSLTNLLTSHWCSVALAPCYSHSRWAADSPSYSVTIWRSRVWWDREKLWVSTTSKLSTSTTTAEGAATTGDPSHSLAPPSRFSQWSHDHNWPLGHLDVNHPMHEFHTVCLIHQWGIINVAREALQTKDSRSTTDLISIADARMRVILTCLMDVASVCVLRVWLDRAVRKSTPVSQSLTPFYWEL